MRQGEQLFVWLESVIQSRMPAAAPISDLQLVIALLGILLESKVLILIMTLGKNQHFSLLFYYFSPRWGLPGQLAYFLYWVESCTYTPSFDIWNILEKKVLEICSP